MDTYRCRLVYTVYYGIGQILETTHTNPRNPLILNQKEDFNRYAIMDFSEINVEGHMTFVLFTMTE